MQSVNTTAAMSSPFHTVLIVEAFSADRELYRRCLLADPNNCYLLLTADSAAVAVEMCRGNQVNAILVGDALPDTNALRFVQTVQAQFGENHPPVVIVAGEPDLATAVQAIKLGAEDYLAKQSLTPEQLQVTIQRALVKGQPASAIATSQLQPPSSQRATAVDSPQQKQAESTLQQLYQDLENRVDELQTLIDIMPIGIAIATDPACSQMQHNACLRQWLGVSPGKNISKSAPTQEQPAFQVFQEGQEIPSENLPVQVAARLGTDVRDTEIEIKLPDGTARQLLSYATPLRDAQNEIRGAVGAFLDITERNRIGAELRTREALLRLFIKHVPAGVAMFDREMRYIVASDRWLTSHRVDSQQSIAGRSHYEIFPDVPERWKAMHQRCLAGAVEACEEDPFPRLDGSLDWVRWETHPWLTDTGEIGGIVIFSEVISDRKQTEMALREREATICQQFAELEGIYATAPIGLCFQDTQLRYVRINDRLAEIDGMSAADHLGRTPREVLPELADTVEPLLHQVIRTGEPILSIEIHGLTQAQPDVRRDWIVSYYPLKDTKGQVWGVNGVVQDITELKQVQAEREQLLSQLKTERRFLEQILQQMPSGVAIAKVPSGELLFHNEEAVRLLRHPMRPSETYEGYAQYGAFHPDGQPYKAEEYPIARTVLTGEGIKAEEMSYQRGDGTYTTLSVNSVPIADQNGQRIAAVSIFEDISGQKQLEQEREQLLAQAQAAYAEAETANRSKDDFVSLVAHELRSPLNAIMGWIELLRTRQMDAVTTQKALETIARNTQAQAKLVEDLLDISRIMRGTLQLTIAPLNLNDVIEAVVSTVHLTAEAKGLQLEVQLNTSAPILGDFNRLQQVVLNLLTNAIKFTPERGQVRVVLDHDNAQARLQIIDTGKGICPDFLPYVFERFRQDQHNTTLKQGLGLGLAIVKHLVEMHQGTVTVESEGEGQGTTFVVRLPLQQDEAKQNKAPVSSHSDFTLQPLADLRVLLVDDDLDTLTLTAFILEQYGAVAQTAANAASALERLPQFQPNILLSDVAMPGQNGYELLRQMRTLCPEGQIPAIALTAHAGGAWQEESLRAGFQQHLTKPVEPETLLKAILKTLGQRES